MSQGQGQSQALTVSRARGGWIVECSQSFEHGEGRLALTVLRVHVPTLASAVVQGWMFMLTTARVARWPAKAVLWAFRALSPRTAVLGPRQ